VQAPAAAVHDPSGDVEPAVDQDRRPVADEHADSDAREAVPRGEEPAGFVQGSAHEPSMDDSRCRLVALAEREVGVVAVNALLGGEWEVDAVRVVSASPARRLVVGRNPLYRSPPRSKWAL
jgi:hypothetical protein